MWSRVELQGSRGGVHVVMQVTRRTSRKPRRGACGHAQTMQALTHIVAVA